MEEMQMENTQAESTKIEGRNAVLEAFRSRKNHRQAVCIRWL